MIVFVAFFALRLFSLYFSIRNEKRLVRRGAIQYGKFNSLLLALAHVAYYFSALYEAYTADVEFEKNIRSGGCGHALRLCHALLCHLQAPRRVDGEALYRAQSAHRPQLLVPHGPSPNYFLNIVPELVGVALLCHAWLTLCCGLPLYLCLLAVRIRQEERAMKPLFN